MQESNFPLCAHSRSLPQGPLQPGWEAGASSGARSWAVISAPPLTRRVSAGKPCNVSRNWGKWKPSYIPEYVFQTQKLWCCALSFSPKGVGVKFSHNRSATPQGWGSLSTLMGLLISELLNCGENDKPTRSDEIGNYCKTEWPNIPREENSIVAHRGNSVLLRLSRVVELCVCERVTGEL